MGRPRIPDAVKNLRGTLRKDRVNTRAPRLAVTKPPAPPREISATERQIWKRLARELPPGVYTEADATAYRALVHAVMLAENPPDGVTASEKIHWTRMAAYWLGRFGMTPSDRERVSVARAHPGDDADPENEFTDGAALRVVK